MDTFLDFLLKVLSQFAGGTGQMENNLVRFSIPAVTYGVLLSVAWSRQREFSLRREKLLVWGFGLGSASAVLMAFFVALQMLNVIERDQAYPFLVPLERALEVASIIVVAGAFLHYILDNERLANMYIRVGAGTVLVCLAIALWQWPARLAVLTESRFHTTWVAWLFEVVSTTFLIIAILLLRQKYGWLPNVVTVALVFFLLGEMLLLLNYATDKAYAHTICPIGNSFPMLAIPLLGYVYIREQAMYTRKAQRQLLSYRDHLEELVAERTSELEAVNAQLKNEVYERKQAENEVAQRNANLAAQNTIAASLSRSIELETILDTVLDAVLSVMVMDVGLVFLWDEAGELSLRSFRGPVFSEGLKGPIQGWNCCQAISTEAMSNLGVVVKPVSDCCCANTSPMVAQAHLKTLVSVPLASNGLALGALTLGSHREEPVQPPELELLLIIGQQIGMALENAQLFHKAEQSAEVLRVLHEVSTVLTSTLSTERIYALMVEQSAKLLNCQTSCVLSWDEEEQRARIVSCFGLSQEEKDFLQSQIDVSPFMQHLIASGESFVVGDTQSISHLSAAAIEKLDARALISVPVRSMDESFGSLFLIDRQTTRRWRQEEIDLIESFVNRAAMALMNASLIKQLEWAAALEERQRIAADMHDGLAQTVSLLGLQIEGAMELVEAGSGQKAVEELAVTRETIDQVSVEVRRSIASLQKTPKPRRSIQDLLKSLPEQLSLQEVLPIQFTFNEQNPLFLPREQGDQALLIVQEALLNAHRHARAQHIALILESEAREIRIIVEDDGIGFEQGAWWENSQDHFGLSIMHSRAARIGGALKIDSSVGQGTRITLTLPLQEHISYQKPDALRKVGISQVALGEGVQS